MDLIRVRQAGEPDLFGFMGVTYGFISDVDIESERWGERDVDVSANLISAFSLPFPLPPLSIRWAGGSRLQLYAFHRLVNLRKYAANIWFLPATAAPPCAERLRFEPGQQLPPLLELPLTDSAAQGWKV